MVDTNRGDVDISGMSEEDKTEHRRQIAQQFESFRGGLETLATRMYTSHFTDEPARSPEYKAIVDAAANWERKVLEKYES